LVLSLVLSLLGFVVAQAQTGSSKPISLPHYSPTTPQGLEGGFWRTDQYFDPVLRLKNVLLKQSLSVTPALYFADGTEYDLPAMTLEPAGVAQVNIRLALENAPAKIQSHASPYGMAGISYQWSWPAVIATIQNTDEISSLTITSSFRSDVRTVHANPETVQAQAVRGSWWLPTPDADGFLVLENSSLSPKQVDVRFSGHAGNQLAEQQFTLPSHGTSFLKFSGIFGDVRGSETTGGVDVRYTGPQYGILVYGGIVDETHGYSASPIMTEDHLDPNRPTHNVALSVPGLLLGNADPAMQFPTGTYFKPYALLHNLSAQALQVSLDLTSQGSSGEPQTVPLAPVSLAPGQVLQYDFSSQFGKSNTLPDGYGSLTASFQGRDGDLQIHAGSVDQSESYVFEVPASQQADSASRTLCFWSIEGDNDSMITLWNYKATPQDLLLTLRYSGGQYVLPIHLAARQSYNLDMLSLVRSRVPDASGNLIPSNITSGSGTLASAGGEDKEISIAMASSVFNVRNATCGSTCYTCDGATQTAFLPNPLNLSVNATQGAQFQITWDTGSVYTNPVGSSWMSGNTAIATVDSNGNVTGQSAGQTGVNVQLNSYPVYANICSADHATPCPQPPIGGGGQTDVVATPTNFTATQGATLPDGTLTWTYSFQSSSGSLSDLSACQVGETVFYPGSAATYVWPLPMVQSTANPTTIYGPATGGGFQDRNGAPNSYQKPYSAASFSATQRLQWECSNYQGGAWQRFVPDITITRAVHLSGSTWQYTITKAGASATANLP
jgi:hypothetical protein